MHRLMTIGPPILCEMAAIGSVKRLKQNRKEAALTMATFYITLDYKRLQIVMIFKYYIKSHHKPQYLSF